MDIEVSSQLIGATELRSAADHHARLLGFGDRVITNARLQMRAECLAHARLVDQAQRANPGYEIMWDIAYKRVIKRANPLSSWAVA
jgi:hypothetical protein